MKFPSISLSREWKELKKFESLESSVRSIVFYAENKASMNHFKSLIDELTESLGREICYITSNRSDPILTTKNNKIHKINLSIQFHGKVDFAYSPSLPTTFPWSVSVS